MKKKYFGTDGIRGKVNGNVINAEFMFKFSQSVYCSLKYGESQNYSTDIKSIIIGKDTRFSGDMLEKALVSGFTACGANVILVGILPTPAISFLVKELQADLGIMITASHNPAEDNGIKIFDKSGFKICSDVENKIEQMIETDFYSNDSRAIKELKQDSEVYGRTIILEDAQEKYIKHLKLSLPESFNMSGLKILLDCANGAAYKIAPKIFADLGAEVIAIGVSPDGKNINKSCGVMDIEELRKKILEIENQESVIGIAFDGDADRITLVNEKGEIIDGDQIIAILAYHLNRENKLNNNYVVGTEMSNLGLETYLNSIGIKLARAFVGDKNVASKMQEYDSNLGGEQSGHIIIGKNDATCDAIKTALQLLARETRILKKFDPVPQFLENIYLQNTDEIDYKAKLDNYIHNTNEEYNRLYSKNAKILLRKSGTENLIRIMVESADINLAKDIINSIKLEIQEIG